jgi:hypothetical protein
VPATISPQTIIKAIHGWQSASCRGAGGYLKPEAKQEAVQNVLANTWAVMIGLARRGELLKRQDPQ